MKVKELISELQACPAEMDVETWDVSKDDFVGVTQVIFEDGCTSIHLHTGDAIPMVSACPDDGHKATNCPTGACASVASSVSPIATSHVDIVFDGPPGPESGRFVEVEDGSGRSIKLGEWVDRGKGLWALRIPDPRQVP